jgi:transposase
LIFDKVDHTVFQYFLENLQAQTQGKPITLVLDNAAWHKVGSLNWYNIKPLYLPPYLLDLNFVERIWKYLKEHDFAHWWTRSREQLREHLSEAPLKIMENRSRVKTVCAYKGHLI